MDTKTVKKMLIIDAVVLEIIAIGAWILSLLTQCDPVSYLFGFTSVFSQSFFVAIVFQIAGID